MEIAFTTNGPIVASSVACGNVHGPMIFAGGEDRAREELLGGIFCIIDRDETIGCLVRGTKTTGQRTTLGHLRQAS